MGKFDIDTEMPFSVETQFFVDQDENGDWTELASVKTILTQGDATVTITNECPDIFEGLF